MSKKQRLVEQVLEMLEVNAVSCSGQGGLRAEVCFWEDYPQGHYNGLMDLSVEGELSCLMSENLQAILAFGVPEVGMQFGDLWREWGKQGCFKCEPRLLELELTPVLRIRHDSYLSGFRGYRFQNSYDAYGNGSNGESSSDLEDCIKLCRIATHPDSQESRVGMSVEEIEVFRKTMMWSYPFEACRGKVTFYKALTQYPKAFDDFFTATDRSMLRVGFDASLTLDQLQLCLVAVAMNSPILLEIPVIDRGRQIAIIRLGDTSVQLGWIASGNYADYTVNFPKWSYELWGDTASYHYYVWSRLVTALFALAGISATGHRIMLVDPSEFTTGKAVFFPKTDYISSMDEFYAAIGTYIANNMKENRRKKDERNETGRNAR